MSVGTLRQRSGDYDGAREFWLDAEGQLLGSEGLVDDEGVGVHETVDVGHIRGLGASATGPLRPEKIATGYLTIRSHLPRIVGMGIRPEQ